MTTGGVYRYGQSAYSMAKLLNLPQMHAFHKVIRNNSPLPPRTVARLSLNLDMAGTKLKHTRQQRNPTCTDLPGGWWMVVMETLEDDLLPCDEIGNLERPCKDAIEQTRVCP